jgi:hypothetical protein
MIKITVEIVPFGNVKDTRKIWEIEICNINTDKNDVANYNVCWMNHDAKQVDYIRVNGHRRKDGLVKLLVRVFRKMGEGL